MLQTAAEIYNHGDRKFPIEPLMVSRTHLKPVELGGQSGPLRLIVFSDYRVQDIRLLIEEVLRLPAKPDLILYAGDDIARFREHGKNLFQNLAHCSRYGLCAVIGNDDAPAIRRLISGPCVFDIHSTPVIVGDYAFLGLEGAPLESGPPIGLVLSPEKEISRHLSLQKRVARAKRIVIVSHAPPFGVLDQALRFSSDGRPRSIGSRALKRFVRKNKSVALIACGHVHRCGGQHKHVGRTLVVNAACHDHYGAVGRFAIATLNPDGKVEVEWREIREVSCVAGIGRRSEERLRAAGIRTVEELACAEPTRLLSALPKPPPRPLETLRARARAQASKRCVVFRSLALPPGPEIFLDLETDPDGGNKYVWLAGLCVGIDGPYQSFFANKPDDERAMLATFLDFAARHPTANFLTFSGSRFEERVLKARLSANGFDTTLCSRVIDLSPLFWRSIALPIDSEELKGVGRFFGYQYRHPGLTGLRVARLYAQRYQRLKGAKRRALKRMLMEYNEDDVRCLPFILGAVKELAPDSADTVPAIAEDRV